MICISLGSDSTIKIMTCTYIHVHFWAFLMIKKKWTGQWGKFTFINDCIRIVLLENWNASCTVIPYVQGHIISFPISTGDLILINTFLVLRVIRPHHNNVLVWLWFFLSYSVLLVIAWSIMEQLGHLHLFPRTSGQ